MTEDQKNLLEMFLGENWRSWTHHCEQHGEDPNDIYVNVLGGEADE